MTAPGNSTQGGRANRSGQKLETVLEALLQHQNFKRLTHEEYERLASGSGEFPPRVYVRQAPFVGLYGGHAKTEFLLRSIDNAGVGIFPAGTPGTPMTMRIEAKRQETSGSVDEKLPFVYLTAIEAIPEDNVILLLEIDGARDGAKRWIQDAVQRRQYQPDDGRKKIAVMNFGEFAAWVNEAFRYSTRGRPSSQ